MYITKYEEFDYTTFGDNAGFSPRPELIRFRKSHDEASDFGLHLLILRIEPELPIFDLEILGFQILLLQLTLTG